MSTKYFSRKRADMQSVQQRRESFSADWAGGGRSSFGEFWREFFARWVTGGFSSLLLMLLLSWGVIAPTQAAIILNYPGPLTGTPVDYQQYSDSYALDLPYSNFTLAACVNLSKYNEYYSGTIFSKRGTENGYLLAVNGESSAYANGSVKFKVQGPQGPVVTSTQVIGLGKTHDVVLVYKSGIASIYIDGTLNVSGSIQAPGATDKPLRIGRDSEFKDSHSHVWNGTLSDLQIHDVALSDEEIKKHDAICRGIPIFDLTVTSPTGGTITGQNINCGTQCKAQLVKDTSVTLTATPKTGYVFTGWGGACSGTSTTCTVSMTVAKTVTATFKPLFDLNVTKTGNGSVTSSPTGINCATDCTEKYAADTNVILTAKATTGNTFTGWGGACSGTSTTCTVKMTAVKTVTATFSPMFNLNATRTGNGNGTIISNPTGISCGGDCNESYVLNRLVTLTATPVAGSTFANWSGACTGTATTCQVTMSQARTVTATFFIVPSITINGSGCITGTGQGVGFSWLLRDSNGNTVASNLNAKTLSGALAEQLAIGLGFDMMNNGFASVVVNGNCIALGNNTLFVGQPGVNPQCQVNSTGCQFNPTIRFVPQSEMLTSIRGFIWDDLNNNGLQDLHETYLSGWTVILKNPNGEETVKESNADGYYEFTGLSAGDYTIAVETRTNAAYTTTQSMVRTVDSVNIPQLVNFGITSSGESSSGNITFSDNSATLENDGNNPIEIKPSDNELLPDVMRVSLTTDEQSDAVDATIKPNGDVVLSDPQDSTVEPLVINENGEIVLTDGNVQVTIDAEGGFIGTDADNPQVQVIVTPEGQVTVIDNSAPNVVVTMNADGSLTGKETAFGTEVTIDRQGQQVVTHPDFPGMQATVNEDGTFTVTDALDPDAVGVAAVCDAQTRECRIINLADGTCYREDSNLRKSFFKKIAGFVSKATGFAAKVAKKITPTAKVVGKVAGTVNKIASFIIGKSPMINNWATKILSWACNTCHPLIAGIAGFVANATVTNSPFLVFLGKVQTAIKVITIVANAIPKIAIVAQKISDWFGKLRTSKGLREGNRPMTVDDDYCVVTLATLSNFTATSAKQGISLQWETAAELDSMGFEIYRAKPPADGQCQNKRVEEYQEITKLTERPIPATGSRSQGASYSYVDSQVAPKTTYCYGLEEINEDGTSFIHWDWIATAVAR